MLLYLCILLACLNIKTVNCDCSGDITNSTAAFDSLKAIETEYYPRGYSSHSNCRWVIYAANASLKVVLYFKDFQTELSYDYLYIHDGDSESAEQIFAGSGDLTGTWKISSNNALFLRFTSDYSVEQSGFYIQYISSDSNVGVADTACSNPDLRAELTGAQITMVKSSVSCSYRINTTGSQGIMLALLINDQSTISVYNGTSNSDHRLVWYSSTSTGTSVHLSIGDSIIVSKPADSGKFVLYFRAVQANNSFTTEAPPTTVLVDYSCSLYHLVATTTNGYVMSPNYPRVYSNNLHCSTTITASNSSASVLFKFHDFAIPPCCDYVEVFDGPNPSYTSFGTEWSRNDNRTSTGSSIHIVFHSDSSGSLRGFALEYTEVERVIPPCEPANYTSVFANSSVQVIESPNYPDNYVDDTLVYWLITKPSENDTITLDIRNIHIEDSLGCIYDNITIYDGACTNSPVLAVICGSEPRLIQDSSGLYILVKFSSDYSVTYEGFQMEVFTGDDNRREENDADDDEGRPLYLIGVFIPMFLIICAIVVGFCLYYRWKKKSNIAPGSTKEMAPSTKPPPLKRRTTHQLFTELLSKGGTSNQEKKPKPQRKTKKGYQPLPGPSGVKTISYSSTQSSYDTPPPPYTSDPAYPPNFFDTSANKGNVVPKPAIVVQSDLMPPSAPISTMFTPNTIVIPTAFPYMTPAEVRKEGLHG